MKDSVKVLHLTNGRSVILRYKHGHLVNEVSVLKELAEILMIALVGVFRE
jgi:ribosome-binding protein aMBF1 (putative translation factor)